jgi:hypothetical protein
MAMTKAQIEDEWRRIKDERGCDWFDAWAVLCQTHPEDTDRYLEQKAEALVLEIQTEFRKRDAAG